MNDDFRNELLANTNPEDYVATMAKWDRMTYLVRELDANPRAIGNIKAMMDYRDLRTQQAWLPNYINELNEDPNASYLEIGRLRETVVRLDKERRSYHNKALGNFNGLVNDMKKRGINFFYRGNIMDPNKEENKYGDPNVRQEMTDFFLGCLYDVEDMSVADINRAFDGKYSKGAESLKAVRSQLVQSSRGYGVDKPLKEDDGDITFY